MSNVARAVFKTARAVLKVARAVFEKLRVQFLKLRVQFFGKLRYRTQGTVWQIFSKQSNTQVDRWGDIRSVADGESGGYWTRGECGAVGDVG